MKVKKIKIKSMDEAFQDFTQAFKKAQSGRSLKSKSGTFFASIAAARKILTAGRIQMLKYIKSNKPNSIYALAKGLQKDIKNVSHDLNFLCEVGLVELDKTELSRNQRRPVLLSDHIQVELVI